MRRTKESLKKILLNNAEHLTSKEFKVDTTEVCGKLNIGKSHGRPIPVQQDDSLGLDELASELLSLSIYDDLPDALAGKHLPSLKPAMSNLHYQSAVQSLGMQVPQIRENVLPLINDSESQFVVFQGGCCTGKSRLCRFGEIECDWKVHDPANIMLTALSNLLVFEEQISKIKNPEVHVLDEAQVISNISEILERLPELPIKLILVSQFGIEHEILRKANISSYLNVYFKDVSKIPSVSLVSTD